MKKNAIWIVVACVMVLVGVLVWLSTRTISAEALAIETRDCLLAGEAACVSKNLDPGELEKLGISSAEFERFVKEWVHERFHGRVLPNDKSVSEPGNNGVQVFGWDVRTDRGPVRPLSVMVAKTDHGLKVVGLVSGLILSDFAFGPDGAVKGGRRNFGTSYRTCERERPSSSESGFGVSWWVLPLRES